jgi:rare lipoprotein A
MAEMAQAGQNGAGGLVWQASPRGRPVEATGSTSRPDSAASYVQAGIFNQRAEAERMRAQFASLGPVEVAPVQGADGPRYRVRIGPMTPADAQATQASMTARGFSGSRIVTD